MNELFILLLILLVLTPLGAGVLSLAAYRKGYRDGRQARPVRRL